MAFCKQCGADLNGANFCPSCGTSADGNAVAPQAVDPRQQTLTEMNRMIVYFGTKEDVYRQYDTVAAEVKERTEKSFAGWIIAAVISLVIGLFSKAVFFYIAIAPFIAAFILLKKKNSEKLAEATSLMNKLDAELAKFYADYGYCPVGRKFTHPDALPILYDYVAEGSANTPSEAINCMKTDIDRAKAEADRKTMIAQNEEIMKNTKKAAKTAKDARNLAALDFLFK